MELIYFVSGSTFFNDFRYDRRIDDLKILCCNLYQAAVIYGEKCT